MHATDRITGVIAAISIWTGRLVAWLIFPMFLVQAFHRHVVDHMRLALNVFATRDVALARRLLREKTSMRAAEFEANDRHFARLKEGRAQSIETSSIHVDIVRDLKRINSHLTSVAYPILEAAGELAQSRLREAVREPVESAAHRH
jgi:phosphate:Na+ symporter